MIRISRIIRSFSNFHCQFCPFDMAPKRKMSTPSGDGGIGKQQKLSTFFASTTIVKTVEKTTTVVNGVVPEQSAATPDGFLFALLTEPKWKSFLKVEFTKSYIKEMEQFLEKEMQKGKLIYPPRSSIFNALNLTPFDEVKVVIIGQDPYHDVGQAHGLSFSVPRSVPPPPSLKNIFTELTNDIPGFQRPAHGCLEAWAKRGVLLLNATLTVEAHQANSHANIGWQKFTDAVIKLVADKCEGVVFLLWGGFAHRKAAFINATATKRGHVIIKTAHPSPLAAARFFGCKCFSKANEALKKCGKSEVDWSLE